MKKLLFFLLTSSFLLAGTKKSETSHRDYMLQKIDIEIERLKNVSKTRDVTGILLANQAQRDCISHIENDRYGLKECRRVFKMKIRQERAKRAFYCNLKKEDAH